MERRAKTASCQHGFVFAAHIYTVGDPTSESDALIWVAKDAPDWAVFADEATGTINFGDCPESHESTGQMALLP